MTFSFWNEIFLSLILGIVQGITEFLPISSTAHLRLISELIIQKDIGLSASNLIQFGTLIAILQYFWPDLKVLFKHIRKIATSKKELSEYLKNTKLWLQGKQEFVDSAEAEQDILITQVIIATIPIIIFALLARDLIEVLREDIRNIAYFLLAGAVLITVSEVAHRSRKKVAKPKFMSVGEVLLIGGFQCLAVFPGVSRSGSALAGGLFLGRDRQSSVRFSFLLSIPALGLAGLYDLIKTVKDFSTNRITFFPTDYNWNGDSVHLSLVSILIGFILAYFVGLACLRWLLKYLATNDSRIFIVYRLLMAFVILWFLG